METPIPAIARRGSDRALLIRSVRMRDTSIGPPMRPGGTINRIRAIIAEADLDYIGSAIIRADNPLAPPSAPSPSLWIMLEKLGDC